MFSLGNNLLYHPAICYLYTHIVSRKFYLDLEIGFPLRKIAAQFSPVHTITIDGRKINLIIEAGPKKKEEDFLLDAEVDKKTEDGRDGKVNTEHR